MKRYDTLLLGMTFAAAVITAINTSKNYEQILRQIQEVQTSLERQISELPLSVNCNK